MTLLVDMNLAPRLAQLLVQAGVEAVHWVQCGPGTAPDVDIMAYAHERGWIVVTHDLDFTAILAATGAVGPSVVQVRGLDVTPEALVGPLVSAVWQCAEPLARGAILTLDAKRLRVRLLPFELA